MKINNRFASEFLIAAYTAALVKVPLVLVSGDEGLCLEAFEFHPEIRTVVVKTGIGDGTVNLHPALAVERIQQGMARALQEDLSRCLIPLPKHFRCEVRFHRHPDAYKAGFYPAAQKVDDHTILYENDSFFEILRFMLFAT
jgi:D-amino peptidase